MCFKCAGFQTDPLPGLRPKVKLTRYAIVSSLGKVTILVNNAGINIRRITGADVLIDGASCAK